MLINKSWLTYLRCKRTKAIPQIPTILLRCPTTERREEVEDEDEVTQILMAEVAEADQLIRIQDTRIMFKANTNRILLLAEGNETKAAITFVLLNRKLLTK